MVMVPTVPQLVYGNPPRSDYETKKQDWVAFLEWVKSMVTSMGYANYQPFASKALMDADLDHDADTLAAVYEGSDSGIYIKVGVSGAGSWSKILNYLPGFQMAFGTISGGTADALEVTTLPTVSTDDEAQRITFFAAENNTGAMTVSFDGGSALVIKTAAGVAVTAPDKVVAGMPLEGYITESGTAFRLSTDISSAAIQAAAEALLQEMRALTLESGSFNYEFDAASQTMADPGTGVFRLNHATPESATAIALAADLADSSSVSAQLVARFNSTSSVKCRVVITSGATRLEFDGSAITNNSGWLQVTVASGVIIGSLADESACQVVFEETGDKGATGAKGDAGSPTATVSSEVEPWLLSASVSEAAANWGYREKLTASRDYYVRSDGSDSNDGLADNAGGAFLTISKAVDVAWGVDKNGNDINIYVRAGTYTTPIYQETPSVGEGRISIIGDVSTPSNVHLNVTGNGVQMYDALIIVKGIKITATARGLYTAWSGTIWFDHVDFGVCDYHMRASDGSIWLIGDKEYSISGGAQAHWSAHVNGNVYVEGASVAISGTPNFTTAFAYYQQGGQILATNFSFTGTATGRYFWGAPTAFLDIGNNIAASYLPGNTAGILDAGAISPDKLLNNSLTGLSQQIIADDAVVSFPFSSIISGIGLCAIHTNSGAKTAVPIGKFRVRAGGSPFIENISLDLTGVVLTTGELTGTTGTDGKFTISAHTDGNVYFENRTAATRYITVNASY